MGPRHDGEETNTAPKLAHLPGVSREFVHPIPAVLRSVAAFRRGKLCSSTVYYRLFLSFHIW